MVRVLHVVMYHGQVHVVAVLVQIFEELKILNEGKCSISENINCSTRTIRYKNSVISTKVCNLTPINVVHVTYTVNSICLLYR